ncbi:hypothetical protein JCM11641_006670 [Rhodosporidiobolus odoratus]
MAASSSSKTSDKPRKAVKPPCKKPRRQSSPHSSAEDSDDGNSVASKSTGVVDSDASSSAGAVKEQKKKSSAPKKAKKAAVYDKAKAKGKGKAPRKVAESGKKAKKRKVESEDDYSGGSASEEDEDEDSDTEDGLNTRVVKQLKKAATPKGNAETSTILPSTLSFLQELAKNNDRDWFQQNDPRYRHAHLNFKTFVTAWVPKASEADWSVPHLPAKDVMHRIYRDVRFSKDKTPYKRYLCASTSRTGRKGPFGLYYVHIQPGNKSFLGCGWWSTGSNELKLFRNSILSNPKPLRKALAEPAFVKLFGEPKPRMDKKRSSIFGAEDELKNAPKLEGVDKTHKDIDLLKCRSFAVETQFSDEVVTSPDFLDTLKDAMETAAPFVQLLNDIISPPDDDDDAAAPSGAEVSDNAMDEEEEEEEEEEGKGTK